MILSKNIFFMCFYVFIMTFGGIFDSLAQPQCLQNYSWATWDNFAGSSSTGTIVSDSKQIGVTMSANYEFASTDEIAFLDREFGTFIAYSAIKNTTVPRTTWAIGAGGKTTMCFSEPVTNPILLLASVGNDLTSVVLKFSEPYIPVFDGGDMKFIDNYSLSGLEGNCIVLFPGTFTCLTIESDIYEYYTNITWGLQPPTFPLNIAGKTTACKSVTLTASGGNTYQWSGGETPNNATNTFKTSGVYKVTSTDEKGCSAVSLKRINVKQDTVFVVNKTICQGQNYLGYKSTGVYLDTLKTLYGCDSLRTLNLTVLDTPTVELGSDKKKCEGEIIELTPVTTGSNTLIYRWSSGETTKNLKINRTGNYKLTVSQLSCSASDSMKLVVNPNPEIVKQDSYCINKPFRIGNIDNNLSYLWEESGKTSPEVTIQNVGVYKLKITNQFGCSVVESITTKNCSSVVFAPNTFTPNEDKNNEVFKIFAPNSTILGLDIYNRWGNHIYTNNINPEWDGTTEGIPCSAGTFIYILRHKNIFDNIERSYFGEILLIR